MTFKEYQEAAMTTAMPSAKTVEYMILGMCNEAGEVAGKWKKKLRDDTFDRDAFLKEVGDVLWYVAGLCDVLQAQLDEVAGDNLRKLQSRATRGVIGGSGDVR